MPLTYPRTFHDGSGEVASGAQVMENLNAAKAVIDANTTAIAANTAAIAALPGTLFAGPYGFSAEVGFGAGPFSATRPTFVTVIVHKPSAPTGCLYTVKVGGVIVCQVGFADGTWSGHAGSGSFILPPNQGFTAESPNLAACQPVWGAWLVM